MDVCLEDGSKGAFFPFGPMKFFCYSYMVGTTLIHGKDVFPDLQPVISLRPFAITWEGKRVTYEDTQKRHCST